MDFPDGLRCRVRGGSVPSVSVYGESGGIDGWSNSDVTGHRAGLALNIPLYVPRSDMCDKPMKVHMSKSALELGEQLVSNGAMSNEEFLKLSEKVKANLFSMVEK